MNEQGVSRIELARRLAGTTEGKAVDHKLRQVERWLKGQRPHQKGRLEIARALGVEPDRFLYTQKAIDTFEERLTALEARMAALERRSYGDE